MPQQSVRSTQLVRYIKEPSLRIAMSRRSVSGRGGGAGDPAEGIRQVKKFSNFYKVITLFNWGRKYVLKNPDPDPEGP